VDERATGAERLGGRLDTRVVADERLQLEGQQASATVRVQGGQALGYLPLRWP
jgi:hypothetical protein